MAIERDPHSRPVPDSARDADARVHRESGRVDIFNATRPGGLDGWPRDLRQYEAMRAHILCMIDKESDHDGSILLKDVVAAAQDRYDSSALFPNGRPTNYVRYTKVERLPGSSPQRICRRRPGA